MIVVPCKNNRKFSFMFCLLLSNYVLHMQLISDKKNVLLTSSYIITTHVMPHILAERGKGDQLLQLLNIMGQIIIPTLLP
jgi:hypothetical protein